MKRSEAEEVWRLLASLYDVHPERRADQAPVWVPALEEQDAEIVMAIVSEYMEGKGPSSLPTLPFFLTEVRVAQLKRNPARHFDAPPECDVCLDNAQVEVAGAMAPCPACEKGKTLEYPLEREGPWGRDGFWCGQKWRLVAPLVVEIYE